MKRWLQSIGAMSAMSVLAATVATGCQSDAETPNAYYGADGGASGELGQPCRSGSRCNDASAVCIDEDTGDAEPPYCRATCDTTATDDPCGAGFVCVEIQDQGDSGACLPAPLLGEQCEGRCDDGLVCVDDGTGGACATACDDDGDCTAPQTCDPDGFCA